MTRAIPTFDNWKHFDWSTWPRDPRYPDRLLCSADTPCPQWDGANLWYHQDAKPIPGEGKYDVIRFRCPHCGREWDRFKHG